MPSVLLQAPGQAPRVVKLVRALTTVGAAADNDLRVVGADLEATHAQLAKDGDDVTVIGLLRDMTVNGRRSTRQKLQDRDLIRIGSLELTFFARDEDAPRPAPPPARSASARPAAGAPGDEAVAAYRRLHDFSSRLLKNESTQALIDNLLDGIVEVTGADKGFLVLIEDGRPVVRAARNLEGASIQTSLDQLSDSIVRKVIETRQPLIVADALNDRNWSASQSVVALKLLSVMCCPLMDREELRGLLYVGNNRVTHVFDAAGLELMTVFAAQASLLLGQARRLDELAQAKVALESTLAELRFGRLVGTCDSMKEVFKRIRKVATADVSVLITGETGTGKELIAREIHEHSRRARGPFVVINCGAIPANLLESELFGHVRGAFTGAVANKLGRFQAANGGTLFLDEIGELPLALQVKLLRALQEHVVSRVGDTKNESVDIRVLAATNRVLEREVKEGRFREDLYYRLNVVNVHVPPLRERGADLELVAKYLLAKAQEEHGSKLRGFSRSCLVAMRAYGWPGNVRELENRIKKAAVLADGPLITAEDLDIQQEDVQEILPLAEARERFVNRYISMALERNGGNRTQTARDLGVDPRTIFRFLEKQGADPGEAGPIPPEDGAEGLLAQEDDGEPPAW
jgi:transcriptional regulator with GAF, ATPase, and Fis domain